MIIEVVLLALASAIRPTSLAAVYALLSVESRRLLMCVYVASGLAFTIVFGLLVVYALHGIHVASGTDRAKSMAELAGGVVVLGFGVLIVTGRVHASNDHDAPYARHRWTTMAGRRLTPRTAAVAGPFTHIPGLFYLIALNVIVAHDPGVVGGTFSVVVYNAVWFVVPLAALAACVVRPAQARDAVGRLNQWARDNARTILACVCLVVGVALTVRGALSL